VTPPAGHPKADFGTLFREQYPRVFRYVRYRVQDDATAEDLTAEIFERAYRAIDSYDPSRAAFSTWIAHIARNWVNNHLSSSRVRYEMPDNDALENIPTHDTPEAHVLHAETIRQLLDCVDRLSERAREVVALRFGANMRNKDIAALLNIKEHTISVILLRALEQLRGCQELP
jgi:RNA polymerase sigma factor (sigma-70 family)